MAHWTFCRRVGYGPCAYGKTMFRGQFYLPSCRISKTNLEAVSKNPLCGPRLAHLTYKIRWLFSNLKTKTFEMKMMINYWVTLPLVLLLFQVSLLIVLIVLMAISDSISNKIFFIEITSTNFSHTMWIVSFRFESFTLVSRWPTGSLSFSESLELEFQGSEKNLR